MNPPQPHTSHPAATVSLGRDVDKSPGARKPPTPKDETHSERKPLALLLDLSGDEKAAMDWAAARLADTNIQPLNKVVLKWTSKREALSRVRALEPDAFCVFAPDLKLQSSRGALLMFALLAGARRVLMGDARGRETSRSRLAVLVIDAPRLVVELLAGYLLLVPLSWVLTEALGVSLLIRAPIRASRVTNRMPPSLNALYIRATLTGAGRGGMQTHVAGFASGTAALGHRLRFLVSGEQAADGATIAIPPSSLLSATKALFEVWNNLVFSMKCLAPIVLSANQPDFIYQRYSRFNWTGVLLASVTGLPLALEYNGSEVWLSRHWDPAGLLWLLKRFERMNLRAADLIVVVSDVERRTLIRAGVNPAKIIVNPNGVDTDRFRPNCGGDEIRRALGIEDRVVVGFVGTFGPWHGAPVLAEAAARINDAASSSHFLFIGTGEQLAQTRSTIESAHVNATFTGSIAHDKVPAYLDACDVLASPHVPPTDGSEFFGSPTKLFEYLAMGKGIVASPLGQIGEVIIDGENGLVVSPGDASALAQAIERLAADGELRARLGRRARQTAIERYTWRHNAARVFDAISVILVR